MKFTKENLPPHLNAMYDEIRPILEKYHVIKDDSSLSIETSSFKALFGGPCQFQQPGCHMQSVAEPDGQGGWQYVNECICPGDPRYVP